MPRIRKSYNQGQAGTDTLWRLGLYKRLSKEEEGKRKQEQGESQSIENQDKILRGFVEEYFAPGTYVIVDVFADDGLTGTDTSRPEFTRLKQCIERKEVNCVIVKSLARAFRNLADQQKFLEEFLPLHGARFISIGSPFIDTYDNPCSVSGFEVPIRGMFNEQFAAATSEEVRKTFKMKRERGEFIGAFAPYGYRKDPRDKNRLLVDEDAARVVRSIFHWFVYGGYSKKGIAQRLNRLGEPNPAAYKRKKGMRYQNPNSAKNDGLWSACTVSGILQNAMYTGVMVQGKHRVVSYKVHTQIAVPEKEWFVVPNTHQAVIDRETFEKAQTLHRRDTRTTPGAGEVHLFSGFVRCPECQKAMHRKTARSLAYYHCRTYTDKKACTKHTIREDTLYKAVLAAIQKQIALVEMPAEELERMRRTPVLNRDNKGLLHSLEQAERQLGQLRNASDCLYVDWKSGDITKEEYVRLKGSFSVQVQRLEQNIACLQEELQPTARSAGCNDHELASFLEHGNIQGCNRGLLVELIDTIWVHERGEITIDFHFADPYLPMVDRINEHLQ